MLTPALQSLRTDTARMLRQDGREQYARMLISAETSLRVFRLTLAIAADVSGCSSETRALVLSLENAAKAEAGQ